MLPLIQRLTSGDRAVINPATGQEYRSHLLYYDMAQELWALQSGKNPWVMVTSRTQLVRLADNPTDQGPHVQWAYGNYKAPGMTYESGPARPWRGKPGFGLRLHTSVILTIHPDCWGLEVPFDSKTTREVLWVFGGVRLHGDTPTWGYAACGASTRAGAFRLPYGRHVFLDEQGTPLPGGDAVPQVYPSVREALKAAKAPREVRV